MYRFISYIKFLFSATNQHGVHSPFIYNFVTKCLYKKSKIRGPKHIKVLLKSLAYFKVENIRIVPKDPSVENLIMKSFPQIKFNQPEDLIFMDSPNNELFTLIIKEKTYHNDTMVLIRDLYKNKKNTQDWEVFKQNENVTVSVDMFNCGALFFRKEQAKEHFKIRI